MAARTNAKGDGPSERGSAGEAKIKDKEEIVRIGDTASILCRLKEELDKAREAAEENDKLPWPLSTTAFEIFIGALVIANCAQMGFEADYPDWELTWLIAENSFTVAFLLEMILKLCILRRAYFQDHGNLFDAALVFTAIIDVWIITPIGQNLDMQSLSVLRIIRMARLLRLLRIFSIFDRLLLIVYGVVDALRTTFWVGLLVCMCIYVCAIICTNLIGHGEPTVYPGYTTEDLQIEDATIVTDFNPHVSFGSMGRSMLTLFNILIMAEWAEVVRPISLKQPYLLVFFIGFSLVVTYGIMNVIVGMIVDGVMQNADAIKKKAQDDAMDGKLQELAKISEIVEKLDLNKDGKISRTEMATNMRIPQLQEMLRKVDLPSCLSVDELMLLLDGDGDGALLFDEILLGLYRLIEGDAFQHQCNVHISINRVLSRLKEDRTDRALMKDMIQKLDASVQELFSEIRGGWSGELLQHLPSQALPLDQNQSPTMTGSPGALQSTADGAQTAEALAARLEAQIAQTLQRVRALDATEAQSTVRLCASSVREELTRYMEKARYDMELRIHGLGRTNLRDCHADEGGVRGALQSVSASVGPSPEVLYCKEEDANAATHYRPASSEQWPITL